MFVMGELHFTTNFIDVCDEGLDRLEHPMCDADETDKAGRDTNTPMVPYPMWKFAQIRSCGGMGPSGDLFWLLVGCTAYV